MLVLAVVAWGAALAWQLHRSPAQTHIAAGNEYARRGDGPNAVREWQLATVADPGNAFAWQLLGQSYFEAHRWG